MIQEKKKKSSKASKGLCQIENLFGITIYIVLTSHNEKNSDEVLIPNIISHIRTAEETVGGKKINNLKLNKAITA